MRSVLRRLASVVCLLAFAQTRQASQATQAIANFRELAEMEAQSRGKAWKVLQDRFQENVANLQKLLKPK